MSKNSRRFDPLSPLEFEEMKRKEVPVKIGTREYILMEAMAGDVINYRNYMIRATRVDASKKTASVGDFAEADIYLISLCLVEITDRGNRKVPVEILRGWRNEVKNKLFTRLQQISDMLEEETIEELLQQRSLIDEKLLKLGYKFPELSEELLKDKEEELEEPVDYRAESAKN